eukprot:snap_masked-scaffold_16-processed-gene-5.32-mRNA-1 protein AED:1.00 eAED:1.00 QI:0/0/0/0/1/1/2/0/113
MQLDKHREPAAEFQSVRPPDHSRNWPRHLTGRRLSLGNQKQNISIIASVPSIEEKGFETKLVSSLKALPLIRADTAPRESLARANIIRLNPGFVIGKVVSRVLLRENEDTGAT